MLYFIGDGRRLPIANMFDVDGHETDDPALTVSIVAETPDGKWLASECWAGDIVKDGH